MKTNNPYLEELRLIQERNHVWNYQLTDDNSNDDRNRDWIEKIYNYIRHEIVDRLNKQHNSGTGNVVVFNVPASLCILPNGTKLKPLKIVFSPSESRKADMLTVYNQTHITIEINVDLFDVEFKVEFAHELKHYVQYSTNDKLAFGDYFFLCKQQKIPYNKKYDPLISLVYYLNPMESDAYCELADDDIANHPEIKNIDCELPEVYTVDDIFKVADIINKL